MLSLKNIPCPFKMNHLKILFNICEEKYLFIATFAMYWVNFSLLSLKDSAQ